MPVNDAQLLATSGFPSEIAANTTFNCDVTFFNKGPNTWISTGTNKFQLGSSAPDNNAVWSPTGSSPITNRFVLPNDVNVGDSVIIPMTLKSPNINKYQSCNWRMVKEGIEWFGDILTQSILVGSVGVSASPVVLPVPYGAGGLISAQICLTPVYNMDGTPRIMRWTNITGVTLEIVKAYVWSGVQINARADVHAELRRKEDGSRLVLLQWDRYAEPTGVTNVRTEDFNNESVFLEDGHSLDLFTHGTDFFDTTRVSQHSAVIWVKNYTPPSP